LQAEVDSLRADLEELRAVVAQLQRQLAAARKNGLIYHQEDGLRQVILGRTSISELLRVLR
jgi:hypothetical protein